jgi:hypothetical protein
LRYVGAVPGTVKKFLGLGRYEEIPRTIFSILFKESFKMRQHFYGQFRAAFINFS